MSDSERDARARWPADRLGLLATVTPCAGIAAAIVGFAFAPSYPWHPIPDWVIIGGGIVLASIVPLSLLAGIALGIRAVQRMREERSAGTERPSSAFAVAALVICIIVALFVVVGALGYIVALHHAY